MRRPKGTLPARLIAFAAAAGVALVSAASGGADSAPALRSRATALRHETSSLAARSHAALLQLYALETQLAAAQTRLAGLERRAAALADARRQTRHDLRIARAGVAISHRQLAQRLRILYEQGEVDPVAVVLGASSLDGAITAIESLNRSARLDESVLRQTLHARDRLRALERTLARRTAAVEAARREAAATAAELAAAHAERLTYLAGLRAQARLDTARIASLDSAAQAAQARSTAAVVSVTAAPVQDVPAQGAGRTLSVVATGYSLPGATATGLATGWGVVAVDPSVIPLGTRLSIPGYGQGVAADVGGSVRGATIDLWFPTTAQANAWGRRTVTVTLH